MKKFQFNLDTVLNYKYQVLDAARSEHAAAMQRVTRQEEQMASLNLEYHNLNVEFREAEKSGITIADALVYENSLRVLEQRIQKETAELERLRQIAEMKRQQVVTARQETASLEKLRERRLEDYRKAVQKSEERFIDELVLSGRFSSGRDTDRSRES